MQLKSHYWNKRYQVCQTKIESLEEKFFHRVENILLYIKIRFIVYQIQGLLLLKYITSARMLDAAIVTFPRQLPEFAIVPTDQR